MDQTITFQYTLNTGVSDTVSFTGTTNCADLRSYILTTIGDGTSGAAVKIINATLSGYGYGSAINLFSNCVGLETLDLSDFDTSNVTSLQYMFEQCSSLRILDLDNFIVNSVTNAMGVFRGCTNLTTIFCNHNWATELGRVVLTTGMFTSCSSLVGAIPFDSSKTAGSYANPTTGYFTSVTPVKINKHSVKTIKLNNTDIDHLNLNGSEIY